MTYPHAAAFRYGSHVAFAVTVAAASLCLLLLNEPLSQRLISCLYAFSLVALGCGGGWLVAHFMRLTFGLLSMRLFAGLCVFYFYAATVGSVTMLALESFSVSGVAADSPPIRDLILQVPTSFGFAAGIRYVLNSRSAAA